MAADMLDAYKEIFDTLEVSPKTAKRALEATIEMAIRKFYRTPDCSVDIESGIANIVFLMPQHKKIIERLRISSDVLPHDLLSVTLDLLQLPPPVKAITHSLFKNILSEMKAEEDYTIWKSQSRSIIDGVVVSRQTDFLNIDLRGAFGILKKDAWVPAESSRYCIGNIFYFYISAVKRLPSGISIILSRSSIRLPALAFKYNLPMYRFICSRRFIGHKSIIHTDAPIRDRNIVRVREKIRQELSGEIMELKPF